MNIMPVNNKNNPSFKAALKFSDDVIPYLEEYYRKHRSNKGLSSIYPPQTYIKMLTDSIQKYFAITTKNLRGEVTIGLIKKSKHPKNLNVNYACKYSKNSEISFDLMDKLPIKYLFDKDAETVIATFVLFAMENSSQILSKTGIIKIIQSCLNRLNGRSG